jgi:ribosomal protein S18 acetylase RimI-like enzyme
MTDTEPIRFEPFCEEHNEGVVSLCRELDWPSYTDPEISLRALLAPGSVTWVACEGEAVVGLAHLLTDSLVQAHLFLIGVRPSSRRRGIAKTLIRGAFRGCGAKWLDLSAEPGSEGFYRSFVHKEGAGFRVYPSEPVA